MSGVPIRGGSGVGVSTQCRVTDCPPTDAGPPKLLSALEALGCEHSKIGSFAGTSIATNDIEAVRFIKQKCLKQGFADRCG